MNTTKTIISLKKYFAIGVGIGIVLVWIVRGIYRAFKYPINVSEENSDNIP